MRKAHPYHPTSAELYPVGEIFLSALPENPEEQLGFGTWEAISASKVFVGVDLVVYVWRRTA